MRTLALAFGLALSSLASGVSAQPDWRALPEGTVLSVDALGSQLTTPYTTVENGVEGFDYVQRLAVALVSGHVPLSPRLALTAELPAGFFSASTDAPASELPTEAQVGIGNLYLGAITALAPEASVEVGVWLPTSTNETAVGYSGLITDFERREAYLKDFASARLVLRGGLPVSTVLRARGVLSPVIGYNTGRQRSGVDAPRANAALVGGAFVDGLLGNVTLTAGTTGRYEPEQGSIFLVRRVLAERARCYQRRKPARTPWPPCARPRRGRRRSLF